MTTPLYELNQIWMPLSGRANAFLLGYWIIAELVLLLIGRDPARSAGWCSTWLAKQAPPDPLASSVMPSPGCRPARPGWEADDGWLTSYWAARYATACASMPTATPVKIPRAAARC